MVLRRREPDFESFSGVLKGKKSEKVHLFELFMDMPVYEYFAERKLEKNSFIERMKIAIDAFYNAGYDYASVYGCELMFRTADHESKASYSANCGGVIKDWDSFHGYDWPDANAFDYTWLEDIKKYLPDGMKLGVLAPGGVLENVTSLIGFEDMCIMLLEDPELLKSIFDKVGQILVDYYNNIAPYDSVGFMVCNDDWGFQTQTFLSTKDMKEYVFPWHKHIVEIAHSKNKPIVLHSCGYMRDVFDDIIDNLKYDAKHSYEDNILSVEESYKEYGDRITILGGLDVNFLINSNKQDIVKRCKSILHLTKEKGRYMLGSGNSLAYYIPIVNIIAMIESALE